MGLGRIRSREEQHRAFAQISSLPLVWVCVRCVLESFSTPQRARLNQKIPRATQPTLRCRTTQSIGKCLSKGQSRKASNPRTFFLGTPLYPLSKPGATRTYLWAGWMCFFLTPRLAWGLRWRQLRHNALRALQHFSVLDFSHNTETTLKIPNDPPSSAHKLAQVPSLILTPPLRTFPWLPYTTHTLKGVVGPKERRGRGRWRPGVYTAFKARWSRRGAGSSQRHPQAASASSAA